LQAWQPGADGTGSPPGQFGDDLTFGPPNAGNESWDQFAVNEQLYGVKTSFDEDAYTTKLDRSAADFKERERKAQKLANEIIGVHFFL
jgi:PAB1-binding protein PBP1